MRAGAMIVGSRVQQGVLVLLLALIAAIAAVVVSRSQSPLGGAATRSSAFDGPTLPPGLRAANFGLRDQNGKLVRLTQYRGRVVVLTFIHSLCHDACPFMVEQIKGALNSLPGGGREVPAIGVSVAAAEDTPRNRRRFIAKHEMAGRLEFLGGSASDLRHVWRDYAIQPVQGPVDHSTFVLLLDKRGFERVGTPADQLTPESLAHDISVLERERA